MFAFMHPKYFEASPFMSRALAIGADIPQAQHDGEVSAPISHSGTQSEIKKVSESLMFSTHRC